MHANYLVLCLRWIERLYQIAFQNLIRTQQQRLNVLVNAYSGGFEDERQRVSSEKDSRDWVQKQYDTKQDPQ